MGEAITRAAARAHRDDASRRSTRDGRPAGRIVLLKGADAQRLRRSSPTTRAARASDLAAHPFAALTFLWKELERQVRIEGAVEKVTAARIRRLFRDAARWARASAPGPARRASRSRAARGSSSAGRSSSEQHGEQPAAPAALGRLSRDARRTSSSGRGGRAACTTASRTRARDDAWRIRRLAP